MSESDPELMKALGVVLGPVTEARQLLGSGFIVSKRGGIRRVGEEIVMSDRVYVVQRDGSWRRKDKLAAGAAEESR